MRVGRLCAIGLDAQAGPAFLGDHKLGCHKEEKMINSNKAVFTDWCNSELLRTCSLQQTSPPIEAGPQFLKTGGVRSGEKKMVGAVRFELTTSCTRNKRASQATLRPDTRQQRVPRAGDDCN
jgi:hypothetical protein